MAAMRRRRTRTEQDRRGLRSAGLLAVALACATCADTGSDAGVDEPTSPEPTTDPATPAVPTTSTATTTPSTTAALDDPDAVTQRVTTGAERLAADGFATLAGQRVGIIANPTARIGDERTVDVLAANPDVELAAIFAPEHGVTGTADAGEVFDDATDASTAVPVYSLYGNDRAPTADALATIDVLLYDLQDVGTRFYTYISTMGLAMQAAAAADVRFMVLDRPNPLGGDYVAGFVRDDEQESFIGQYPIPSAYGMTAGELALAIVGEAWLDGLDDLDLEVVPMQGWQRGDRWPDTGLTWVAPSPGLPSFDSAATYPGTVLFEATTLSYGTGTAYPFHTVGAPWPEADAVGLAAGLNERELPGIRFLAARYRPEVRDIAPNPRLEGVSIEGVRLEVTDPSVFDPVATGVHLIDHFRRLGESIGEPEAINRPNTFALLAGTTRLRTLLTNGITADAIVAAWAPEVEAFRVLREPYLLYE